MNDSSPRQILGLRAIAALASDLTDRKPPAERIQAVLSAVLSVLDVEQVVLAVLDPTGAALTVRAAAPALGAARFERGSFAWTVAAFGRAEIVPDLAADLRRAGVPPELMVRRTLCVPIRIAGSGRGVLLAGSMDPGTTAADAFDLFLLETLANFAADVLVEEIGEEREQRFHSRLARLSAFALEDRRTLILDKVVRDIAMRQGLPVEEGTASVALLAQLCLATRASAAAVALLDAEGVFRIERAWGLPSEVRVAWCEPGEASRRFHDDGGRMTCFLPGVQSGFPEAGLDLRVLVASSSGQRVLHVLSPRERMAFSREDARCAELAAVQMGACADRAAAAAEIASLRGRNESEGRADRARIDAGDPALATAIRVLEPEFLQPLDA